ncbi:hypothetical protein [Paraburkholderia tropica]
MVLEHQGLGVNRNRVYRLYTEECLSGRFNS